MRPTPEIEMQGLRAYEQARAFESLRRIHLPMLYAGITVLLGIAAAIVVKWDQGPLAIAALMGAVLFPILVTRKWLRLKARYEENLRLLEKLEAEYGEVLPWIEVEQHFAALEELQMELADEQEATERAEQRHILAQKNAAAAARGFDVFPASDATEPNS